MPLPLLIALLVALAVIGALLWRSRRVDTNFTRLDEDDLLIGQAKIEAQAGLERFMRLKEEEPERYFSVKIALNDSYGNIEHIWVDAVQVGSVDAEWSGSLANKPHDLKGLKLGSPVTFPQSDIEDWMVMNQDGTYEGGFSLPAVMRRN